MPDHQVRTVDDPAVVFRLANGDEIAVVISEDGILQVTAIANRGSLLVLPATNNSIQIVTAHHPRELGRRKVDLLKAPIRKV